jgi:phosphoglycerate kinase
LQNQLQTEHSHWWEAEILTVKQFGLEDELRTTGGGAMLEMLEGRTLPGIAAILD